MGAWTYTSIGNDDALDLLNELYQSRDVTVIRTALRQANELPEDLSEAAEFRALAAAEVVACHLGRPATGKKCATLADWVRDYLSITPDLVPLARQALASIKMRWSRQDSWHKLDGTAQAKWLACAADLETRLA